MTVLPLATRLALLRQYGTFTQAYSAAMQPGLSSFGDERGFISYKKQWGTAMVLADPMAPAEAIDGLLDRFLGDHPKVAFWDISYPLARKLAARGFRVNELGIETKLDLASYSIEGQRTRNIRKAVRHSEQLGIAMQESPLASTNLDEIRRVSRAWMGNRPIRDREVGFLNRPLVLETEPDVRWLFALREGALVAFCVCDPVYKDGAVVAYSLSTRQVPEVSFIGHALKHHAIELFRNEGREYVTFGLSPVEHDFKIHDLPRDWAVRRSMRYAFNSRLFNRYFYSLQGLATHKRQFGGTTEQTFLAFNTGIGVLHLVRMLRACGIV